MKLFKVYIFIIMFIYGFSANAQEYWLRKPAPTTALLYRCTFTDTLNGWAVGDSGKIIHTSDGGNNWTLQNSTINYPIEEVFFLNQRLGWALANNYFFYGTIIIKTTNGGINWSASLYPDTTFYLYTVYYLDSLNGYMAGTNGVILKTTNAGNSWIHTLIDSNLTSHFPIYDISFRNSQIGLACGGAMELAGVLWQTTNSGYHWKTRAIAPEPLFDIVWIDSSNIIIAGGDYDVGGHTAKSFNGGEDWIFRYTGVWGVGRALAYRTPYEVWIPHGFSLKWALSTDSARTWSEISVPDTCGIYDALFIDSLHGWAVGEKGAVYKFNSSLIGINSIADKLPLESRLFQNYPNPFNPSTNIYFTLSHHSRIRITLFDMLGREIRILLEGILDAGRHSLNFNASGLSTGVYFYRIEAGKYTETKKMVLIK